MLNPSFLTDLTGEVPDSAPYVDYPDRVSVAKALPAVLERFGIVDPSPQTVAELSAWYVNYRTPAPGQYPWGERAHLMQLVMLSPDFQMA